MSNVLYAHIVSPMVAVAVYTDSALASLPDTLRNVAHRVMDDPWLMLGVGCAAGALTAGLAVGLAGRHQRRNLQMEVEEAERAADQARLAAYRSENMLQELMWHLEDLQKSHGDMDAGDMRQAFETVPLETGSWRASEETGDLHRRLSRDDTANLSRSIKFGPEPSAKPAPQHKVYAPISNLDARLPMVDDEEAEEQASARKRLAPWQRMGGQSVSAIGRGGDRTGVLSKAIAEGVSQGATQGVARRSFTRGVYIDNRVPKIQLEPDEQIQVQPIKHEPMPDDTSTILQRAAATPVAPDPEPTPQDAAENAKIAAHVEQMVQEELEYNRSGSARRYSRSHLTVFEGTGDLSAARKALTNKPQHLKRISREA